MATRPPLLTALRDSVKRLVRAHIHLTAREQEAALIVVGLFVLGCLVWSGRALIRTFGP